MDEYINSYLAVITWLIVCGQRNIFSYLSICCNFKCNLYLWKDVFIREINSGTKRGVRKNLRNFSQNHGQHNLAPKNHAELHNSKGFKDLIKPLGFTLLVSGCSFTVCAIWQYESISNIIKNKGMNQDFYKKAGSFRKYINYYWNVASPAESTMFTIISINVMVYLAWKMKRLQPLMNNWFTSSPYHGRVCLPMLLSTFSHFNFLHLLANMYILHSFTPLITNLLGREHFVAVYLSGGVISIFTSYVYKIARCQKKTMSLGASGAVIAMLGMICSTLPESRFSIIFLDQIIPHSFSAKQAMYGIIAVDLAGCLFGWRVLDHACHLGGMLFGIWYAQYGYKLIWNKRAPFIKKWHNYRK